LGEIVRGARGRIREDPTEHVRSGHLDEGTSPARAVSGTEPFDAARCAARRKDRGATQARIGGTCCASWVGDTAEALTRLSCAASRKGRSGGSGRTGSPVRVETAGSEKVLRARAKPREPFTRLGRVGLGPRVRPEIALRSRADAGGHYAPSGKPAGDEASEVRRQDRRLGQTTLGRDRSTRRSELVGVNPKALTSRGNVDVTCAETWGDRL